MSHDRDFLDRVVTSTLAHEGEGRWTEYAGGYSDMLAQRSPAMPEPERRRVAGPQPKAAASRKLSFKDRQALEALPAEMEELRRRIGLLQGKLAEPGLYNRSPAVFAKATEALRQAEAALAKAEERWLELELLREASEA